MPESQNSKEQNESQNAYQYNPNRPQNGTTEEHADTKKVVDTAAKGAAEYFAPGVGGMAYDAAKKVPGVGNAIDKTTDKVAEVADQVPGVKNITKGLNDSGITDVANKGIDLVGSKGAKSGANALKDTKKIQNNVTPNQENSMVAPTSPVRKNSLFNSTVRNGEEDESVSMESLPDDQSLNDESENISDLQGDDLENNSKEEQQNAEAKGDITGQALKFIWDKYKVPIILGGGGIFFFLLFLIIILSGGINESMQNMGYIESACNYNDTRVSLTNCYQDINEKETLSTYELDDFIIQMTYAYIKDGNYSDEAIKALMVILKTNALSYGNYNSSSKNIEVKICDIFSEYNQVPEENEDDLWMLEGVDKQVDFLTSLYEEVSNYLYISSSYQSTISSLSSQNILNFDHSILENFEDLASEGKTYSQILNYFYNTESTDSDQEDNVYRETLYLGDSRTRGMQNAGVINNSNTIYGVGYGYNWLIGSGSFNTNNTNATVGGIAGINGLMRDHVNYNIVIWLGVNDLSNVENYYQKYYELATGDWSNHNIYIVSVGPVDDNLSMYATNEKINNFNERMKELITSSGLNNLIYLDLGYTQESIKEYDGEGIHYSSSDYENIYNIIGSYLEQSLSREYQLYNLTDYCTYYNVTENDAYWWPVGSRNATQGNIYGGDPVSTNITSTFGGRYHPTTGVWQNAHGAIDIGVSEGTPVIATKSGKVNSTNTGCSVGDHSCGGSYGNYIKIDHGDGIESLYAHLKSLLVSNGETVNQGQIIGYSGNTGRSTGPHLHFEIRVNGTRVDPLGYVNPENPRPVNMNNIHFNLSGDSEDNKNTVCETLLSSGLSQNAVAGIMVNMQAESGFSPINLQNSYENSLGFTDSAYTVAVDNGTYTNFIHDSAGYGLVQWTYYNRKQNLYNFAKSKNTSIGDMGMQLEFFLEELQGYTTTYKYVTGNYDAYDISYHFCTEYERPSNAISTCTSRVQNNIENMLKYVQNGCSN